MSTYTPDVWVVVKITSNESAANEDNTVDSVYKVLAGWYGGFVRGDSWKLNSGIKQIVEKDTYYEVHGYSKSVYICYKGVEQTSNLTESVFLSFKEDLKDHGSIIKVNMIDILPEFN